MSSIFTLLNSFIPFADPTRPLWHDVILSAILCTFLYVAPQLDVPALKSRYLRYRPETEAAPEHAGEPLDGDVEDEPLNIDDIQEEEEEDRQEDEVHEEQGGVPGENGEAPEAGAQPANPAHQPRPRDPNREVGAKKAKSIARRNQQRAYNEFLREQGDAQRAEWRRDEERRNEIIQVEKERRAAIEVKVREKQRKEREERRVREEEERREEVEKGKEVVRLVEESLEERAVCDLTVIAREVGREEEWVRTLVKKEGLLGRVGEGARTETTFLTGSGWIVRVGKGVMDQVYEKAVKSCDRGSGTVTWEQMCKLVQEVIVKR